MKKQRRDHTPGLIRVMQWLFPKLERWVPFLAQRFFRLVFYVPVGYPVPEKEKEAEAAARKFTLISSGKRIQGYEWGNPTQPYVLVMHGWAGRATQFRKFIKPFEDAGYRVIGFDGPAHGKSQGVKTSILEFEAMLYEAFQVLGEPVGIITHSFGGAAVIYAASHGLPVKTLVNIASPSVADEILKTYLRAINGSWASAEKFKGYVKKATGKTFEEFTSLHAIQHLPSAIHLLIVQDDQDEDVYFLHATALQKVYPAAELYRTSGLGHTRILKDDQVIQKCIQFITGAGKR